MQKILIALAVVVLAAGTTAALAPNDKVEDHA
jgi:hypothetical protein